MRGEHQVGTFRNFGGFINEDGAALGQGVYHITVVDDFFAHVDGGTVFF